MAPHLTAKELDFITAKHAAGKSPIEIHSMLVTQRARKETDAPHITKIRKAIKGETYQRGRSETRGRKQRYSRKQVLKMDSTRKSLAKSTKNNREIRWKDIQKRARVPKAQRTTIKRAFNRAGIKAAARRPRAKPRRAKDVSGVFS